MSLVVDAINSNFKTISERHASQTLEDITEMLPDFKNASSELVRLIIGASEWMPPKESPIALSSFINNATFSDILLISMDGISIYSHKLLLSLRLPYFCSQLAQLQKTSFQSISSVKIDFPAQILLGLLEFVYTDNVSKKELFAELLPLATMYKIKRLELLCSQKEVFLLFYF